MFERYRRAPLYLLPLPPLVLLAVAHLGDVTYRLPWLAAINRVTRDIVSPPFVVALIALGVVLAIVLVGRLELDDIGLDRDDAARGIGLTLMTWFGAQVLAVLPRVVSEDPIAIHGSWLRGEGLHNAGTVLLMLGLAALIDVALVGFLLVQLYLRWHQDGKRSVQGLRAALLVTVLLADLTMLILAGLHSSDRVLLVILAASTVIAVLLCWIYIRTGNLFFTIGVHTLLLAPTPLVAGIRGEPQWFHSLTIGIVAILWTLLWPAGKR